MAKAKKKTKARISTLVIPTGKVEMVSRKSDPVYLELIDVRASLRVAAQVTAQSLDTVNRLMATYKPRN